jgi:hypothetical protein
MQSHREKGRLSCGKINEISVSLLDRAHTNAVLPHEQLIHNETNKPKTYLVYSRRGRKGNSG